MRMITWTLLRSAFLNAAGYLKVTLLIECLNMQIHSYILLKRSTSDEYCHLQRLCTTLCFSSRMTYGGETLTTEELLKIAVGDYKAFDFFDTESNQVNVLAT